MKLKLISKCWVVGDSKQCNSFYEAISCGYCDEVYAETQGQAKRKCRDYENFLDVRAIRKKEEDIVELEDGKQMIRRRVKGFLQRIEETEKRNKAILELSDTELYYVQNGYVGNSVLFWAKGCSGYTTDVNNSEKFTKEEIVKMFLNGRRQDVIWQANHINENIRSHVDAQYLESKFKV